MVAKDPAERSRISRLGALSCHAKGKTNTAPAREAFLARFEREVDPEGMLDPAERAKRADYAMRVYFTRLSRKAHGK